ncbi:MAG TPA: maleylpyruvate isomerase N-terminal domain-containing protein [Candidatus Dormibacteraeota bacterium]|jgi:uncharacterized damage-inducible protein DinB
MDRTSFLDRVDAARREWEATLAAIPEARMTEPALAGGWSVKDVVAHVWWSEREIAGAVRQRALVGSGLWSLDTDARNAIVRDENRDRPLDEVLAAEREVWAELRSGLETLTDRDLADRDAFLHMSELPAAVAPWHIFAGATFRHYEEHGPDLARLAGVSSSGPAPGGPPAAP